MVSPKFEKAVRDVQFEVRCPRCNFQFLKSLRCFEVKADFKCRSCGELSSFKSLAIKEAFANLWLSVDSLECLIEGLEYEFE